MLYFISAQILVGYHFIFPFLLKLFRKKSLIEKRKEYSGSDYAVIVTYYKKLTLLPELLRSLEKLNYDNFLVYIVADDCVTSEVRITNPKVIFLVPPEALKNNIYSHRFAMKNFLRTHDRITIIDGDNLIHPDYLKNLNLLFDKGFAAVQGARYAKNLNNDYANLDGVSDLYFRYVDRELLHQAGSSATLSGSGMAFTSKLYTSCVEKYSGSGIGFDKVVQNEIVNQGYRIAFTNDAIVWDQKTTDTTQLKHQRGRWIQTWLKSFSSSSSLFFRSLLALDRNGIFFSLALFRPPVFILAFLSLICIIGNLIYFPILNLLWLILICSFLYVLLSALRHYNAPKSMYLSLYRIPKFLFYQVSGFGRLILGKPLSIATEHKVENNIGSDIKVGTQIRILHTIRQGEIGGGETHLLDLVQNLDKERFKSYVISFTNGPMVDRLKEKGIDVFIIPTTKPFNPFVWGQVSNILLENNIEMIHVHGTRALSNTFFSSWINRIPIIYTVHGWSFHQDQSFFKRWVRRNSEAFLLNQAAQTIVVSNADYSLGQANFKGFSANVIRNAVNLLKFDPSRDFRNFRKTQLNIDPETFLVGFIARITNQKNPFLLLEALAILPKSLNIKLLIVGDGDLKDDVIERTRDLQLTDKVIILNGRSDVDYLLHSIDLYCLPSLWEGLSIGLLEAMAMKKAVIVSKVGGNVEVVKNMDTGIVITPTAPELAAKIEMLYWNRELAQQLGQNAFKLVINEFNIENMVKQVEDTYFELNSPVNLHNQPSYVPKV